MAKRTHRPKPRSDAWDAHLTEAQRWQAYDLFRRSPWYEVAEWAREEFGLDRAPARSAMYRWAARMREQESARRIERAVAARDEAGALVAARTDDADTIAAYKALAQELALSGDAETARTYTRMALDLAAAQTKRAELELKAAAQETKDAQLKLAREKFEAAEARLNEAKGVVADAKLTDAERTAKMKEIFGL
jgi:hypothetical protein